MLGPSLHMKKKLEYPTWGGLGLRQSYDVPVLKISLVGWCLVYVLTGNTMAQPGAQLGGLFS